MTQSMFVMVKIVRNSFLIVWMWGGRPREESRTIFKNFWPEQLEGSGFHQLRRRLSVEQIWGRRTLAPFWTC